MAQNNMVQDQPSPRVGGISRTELRHENAAWLLSTVQNSGNDVRILGYFWRRISQEKPAP